MALTGPLSLGDMAAYEEPQPSEIKHGWLSTPNHHFLFARLWGGSNIRHNLGNYPAVHGKSLQQDGGLCSKFYGQARNIIGLLPLMNITSSIPPSISTNRVFKKFHAPFILESMDYPTENPNPLVSQPLRSKNASSSDFSNSTHGFDFLFSRDSSCQTQSTISIARPLEVQNADTSEPVDEHSAYTYQPPAKRAKFAERRRKEVGFVREIGACFRCRILKISVSYHAFKAVEILLKRLCSAPRIARAILVSKDRPRVQVISIIDGCNVSRSRLRILTSSQQVLLI